MAKRIVRIGNGNLGSNFTAYFKEHRIDFERFESGNYFKAENEYADEAIYFFFLPDDKILKLMNGLEAKNEKSIYIYSSAAISRQEFQKELQDQIVQMHPMYSFPKQKLENLTAIPFYIEGKKEHLKDLKILFPKFQFIEANLKSKEAYHLLGVFSSNFQIALMQISKELAKENALDYHTLKKLLIPIMKKTIENIESEAHLYDALSGPLKRGDRQTIAKHENYLQEQNQGFLELYKLLNKELEKVIQSKTS